MGIGNITGGGMSPSGGGGGMFGGGNNTRFGRGDVQRVFGSAGEFFTGNRSSAKASKLAWKREMYASNTAYQRGVADMKAAGLNPMLAYSQGGASTPSAGPSEVRALGGEVVRAYTGLMGAGSQRAVANATTENLRANTAYAGAQTLDTQKAAELKDLEIKKNKQVNPQAEELSKTQLASAKKQLEISEQQLKKASEDAKMAATAASQAAAMAAATRAAQQVGLAAARANLSEAELRAKIAQVTFDNLPGPGTVSKIKDIAVSAFESVGAGAAKVYGDLKFKYQMHKQHMDEFHRKAREGKK